MGWVCTCDVLSLVRKKWPKSICGARTFAGKTAVFGVVVLSDVVKLLVIRRQISVDAEMFAICPQSTCNPISNPREHCTRKVFIYSYAPDVRPGVSRQSNEWGIDCCSLPQLSWSSVWIRFNYLTIFITSFTENIYLDLGSYAVQVKTTNYWNVQQTKRCSCIVTTLFHFCL